MLKAAELKMPAKPENQGAENTLNAAQIGRRRESEGESVTARTDQVHGVCWSVRRVEGACAHVVMGGRSTSVTA